MASDLTRCNQKPDCPNPPAYRFTWAGRDEAAICSAHAVQLAYISKAMGYYCQLIPLDAAVRGDAATGEGR